MLLKRADVLLQMTNFRNRNGVFSIPQDQMKNFFVISTAERNHKYLGHWFKEIGLTGLKDRQKEKLIPEIPATGTFPPNGVWPEGAPLPKGHELTENQKNCCCPTTC